MQTELQQAAATANTKQIVVRCGPKVGKMGLLPPIRHFCLALFSISPFGVMLASTFMNMNV